MVPFEANLAIDGSCIFGATFIASSTLGIVLKVFKQSSVLNILRHTLCMLKNQAKTGEESKFKYTRYGTD